MYVNECIEFVNGVKYFQNKTLKNEFDNLLYKLSNRKDKELIELKYLLQEKYNFNKN